MLMTPLNGMEDGGQTEIATSLSFFRSKETHLFLLDLRSKEDIPFASIRREKLSTGLIMKQLLSTAKNFVKCLTTLPLLQAVRNT